MAIAKRNILELIKLNLTHHTALLYAELTCLCDLHAKLAVNQPKTLPPPCSSSLGNTRAIAVPSTTAVMFTANLTPLDPHHLSPSREGAEIHTANSAITRNSMNRMSNKIIYLFFVITRPAIKTIYVRSLHVPRVNNQPVL